MQGQNENGKREMCKGGQKGVCVRMDVEDEDDVGGDEEKRGNNT